MKKLLTILTVLFCVAAHGQQNMPSLLYRFWQGVRIGSGINDNGFNNPAVALYIGKSNGNQGVYLVPQDTLFITNPPQGLVISLSSDLGRLWQFNGTIWERLGGSGGGGGPFETPLTFSNGLLRTGNAIKIGGNLNVNTAINGNGFTFSFNNSSVAINTLNPQFNLDVGGTARITSYPLLPFRDTLLTYDPLTHQVSATIRPKCFDSASVIDFQVGVNAALSGDQYYVNAALMNQRVEVFREGDFLTPDEVNYNSNLGQLFFTPALNYRERIHIKYYCLTGQTSITASAITTETGVPITTETGVIIIYN